MASGPWRVATLRWHWRNFNQTLFEGKLTEPRFGIEHRDKTRDGRFIFRWSPRIQRAFPPPHYMWVHRDLFDYEDELLGTIIHEMCHQYDVEVLGGNGEHHEEFMRLVKEKGGIP